MNLYLLDGSPKPKGSTSLYLLKALESRLTEGHRVVWQNAREGKAQDMLAQMDGANVWVIAFPLYVDGIPSHLLRLMEALEPLVAQAAHKPKVYVIINCGFYDARQNHIALSMMRVWAERCGLAIGCALAIGGGGMVQAAPLGYGPVSSMGKGMDWLAARILAGEDGSDLYVEPNFPRLLYKTVAHIGWRRMAGRNKVSPQQMKRRLV